MTPVVFAPSMAVAPRRILKCERGSEPVSFALVVPLVMFLVLGVLQLALSMWVKTTLIDAASAGAHAAAVVGAPPEVAEETVREVLASTVGRDYVQNVEVSRVNLTTVSNQFGSAPVDALQVSVSAPLPVLGFFGFGSFQVVGHAAVEVAP